MRVEPLKLSALLFSCFCVVLSYADTGAYYCENFAENSPLSNDTNASVVTVEIPSIDCSYMTDSHNQQIAPEPATSRSKIKGDAYIICAKNTTGMNTDFTINTFTCHTDSANPFTTPPNAKVSHTPWADYYYQMNGLNQQKYRNVKASTTYNGQEDMLKQSKLYNPIGGTQYFYSAFIDSFKNATYDDNVDFTIELYRLWYDGATYNSRVSINISR